MKQLKEEIIKYNDLNIRVKSGDVKQVLVDKLLRLISMKKLEMTSRKDFSERREKRKEMSSGTPGICDFLIRTRIHFDAFCEKKQDSNNYIVRQFLS